MGTEVPIRQRGRSSKEANEVLILKMNIIISEMSGNVAQDLANFMYVWIYIFVFFRSVAKFRQTLIKIERKNCKICWESRERIVFFFKREILKNGY